MTVQAKIAPLGIVFRSICPTCKAEASDADLLRGEIPHEPGCERKEEDERLSKIVRRETEQFTELFRFLVGSDPWSAQRNWIRRFFRGDNFPITAPTGMGKTTFGLILALYLAGTRGFRSYVIVPTGTLVNQCAKRLLSYIEHLAQNPQLFKQLGFQYHPDSNWVLFYHGGLSQKRKREAKERIQQAVRTGSRPWILITTVQFLQRPEQRALLSGARIEFAFVDDVDSFLRSSKVVHTVLNFLGFDENLQEVALKLTQLRTELNKIRREIRRRRKRGEELHELQHRESELVAAIKAVEQQIAQRRNELSERRGGTGCIIVSGAFMAVRRTKVVKLLGVTVGFEVGHTLDVTRRIRDVYVEVGTNEYNALKEALINLLVQLERKPKGGVLIYVPECYGTDTAKQLARDLAEDPRLREIPLCVEPLLTTRVRRIERFSAGEVDALVGLASLRSALTRGIDIPHRIRYAIFFGVPRRILRVSLRSERSPRRIFLLLASLDEYVKDKTLHARLSTALTLLKPYRALSKPAEERIVTILQEEEPSLVKQFEELYDRVVDLLAGLKHDNLHLFAELAESLIASRSACIDSAFSNVKLPNRFPGETTRFLVESCGKPSFQAFLTALLATRTQLKHLFEQRFPELDDDDVRYHANGAAIALSLSVHRGSTPPSGLLHDLASSTSVWKEAGKAAIRYKPDEDLVELTYTSPKAYLQASGRTSRMFPGGISRGLAITLVDDPYAFDQLIDDVADILGTVRHRGRRTRTTTEEVVEFEPFDPQEILKYLREEVDADRQTISAILEGRAPKEIGERVRTALLIVESPTKARTIGWLFGGAHRRRIGELTVYETLTENYVLQIAPTGGHVFDLITGVDAARVSHDELFGVRVRRAPDGKVQVQPIYYDRRRCPRCGYTVCEPIETCPICREEGVEVRLFRGIDVVNALRYVASEVDVILIGTDPDAEGEKIGWDIALSLYPYNPNIYRVRFHEITRTALKHAIENPEPFNMNLVRAQLLRRIDDRWVGFLLSRIIEPQAVQRELLRIIPNRALSRIERVITAIEKLSRHLPQKRQRRLNRIIKQLAKIHKKLESLRQSIGSELPRNVNEALNKIKVLAGQLQEELGKVQKDLQSVLDRIIEVEQVLSRSANRLDREDRAVRRLQTARSLLTNVLSLLEERRQSIDRFVNILRRRFSVLRHIGVEGIDVEIQRYTERKYPLVEERPLFRTLYSAGRVQSVVLLWTLQRREERKKRRLVIRTRIGDTPVSFSVLQPPYRVEELRAFKKELLDYIKNRKTVSIFIDEVVQEKKDINPPPPFTTETLLQEANRRLGLSASETMRLAQDLFECGLITYPRTDSPHVSAKGIAIARDYIERRFGSDYYKGRPWGPEGAHECIRPTSPIDARRYEHLVSTGQKRLPRALTPRHWRLYDLIFRRFIASQMRALRVQETRAKLHLRHRFSCGILETGPTEVVWRKLLKDGFNRLWPIKLSTPPKRIQVRRKLLARVERATIVPAAPLYSEGELVRLMMERGVGRPSTYARTIEVLKRRGYLFVQPRSGRVIITSIGRRIAEILWKHYKRFVREDYTRKLHQWMDEVEEGACSFSEIITCIYDEIVQIAGTEGLLQEEGAPLIA